MGRSTSIDNSEDSIDSRDVIERIEALHEIEQDDLTEADRDELAALCKLASDCESWVEDWEHGAQLIRYSYFQAYAQEFAEDCGMVDTQAKWPMNCIDWEQAANELRQDYSEVDFAGVAYLVRS